MWGRGEELQGHGGGQAGSRLVSLTLLGVLRSSPKAVGPPRHAAPQAAEPRRLGSTKARPEGPSRGLEEGMDQPASSESDAEGPIAAQMLSFVMDDPDFESDSDTQRRAVRTSLAPTLPASPGQLGGPGQASWGLQGSPMGCRVRQARLTLLWGQLGGAAESQLPHAG